MNPEKSLRVALVADPMLPVPPKLYGGIERIIDMLARGLADRGHDVMLAAHRDSATAGRLVPYPGERTDRPADIVRNARTVWRLRDHRPDIVHSFGRLFSLGPLLRARVPKLMSYQREPTLPRIRLAYRLARRDTLAFTGCSEHIAGQIRTVAPSFAIFNGVPLQRYQATNQISPDAPLIFLGRIEAIKGTHNAIEIARLSGRRLIIAGNIADQAYFDRRIAPCLSERITFTGPVDDEQKNELLGAAAALLMPIEWEEPFGIVMAEALACGTPVIGTPRGAVPEVVIDGRTGFVRESVAAMAESVESLPMIDRTACRADCEARFSDAAIVDEYVALYRQRIGVAARA